MQFVGNGFLKAQGYHKGQLFDPARPAESLSHLVNAVFKRQFGLKVNSATYIRPAVTYIQVFLNCTSNSAFQNLKFLSVRLFQPCNVLKLK
jgi:hypothetical protein